MPSDSRQDKIRKRATDNLSSAPKKEELTESIGRTIRTYDHILRENAKEASLPYRVRFLVVWASLSVALMTIFGFITTFLDKGIESGITLNIALPLLSIVLGNAAAKILTVILEY